MIEVEEALQHVLGAARPKPPERVPLREALGRTLAEDIASDYDSPPHDKALVDGYAVQSHDFTRRGAREPGHQVELAVIEEVTAGCVPEMTVTAGHATRVMTGAPIPEGADAVVMREETTWQAEAGVPLGVLRFTTREVAPSQNIMCRATSLRRGQVVLCSGRTLRPTDIGLLAEVGRQSVAVGSRPRLAVLPTGNELVDVGTPPGPGRICNSNGPMLSACARQAGALVSELGIGRDDEEQLAELVQRGLAADVLLISGGVSAGVLDLVPKVLEAAAVEQVFHRVRLKPGKPLWFGVKRHGRDAAAEQPVTLVFGLPGNPVSSYVCFELFVRPALARLAGEATVQGGTVQGGTCHAALDHPHQHWGDRPTYWPARFEQTDSGPRIDPVAWHGSADLRALADANALAIFPAGDKRYEAGDVIEVRPVGGAAQFVWPQGGFHPTL